MDSGGFAFASVVTDQLPLFKASLGFYSALGCCMLKSYYRDTRAAFLRQDLEGVSADSVREVWYQHTDSGFVVKVRLVAGPVSKTQFESARMVLEVGQLDTAIKELEAAGFSVTKNTVEDPIGNQIMLVAQKSHEKPAPGPKTVSEPKKDLKKKIAVMTSGGDLAGMNAAVRAVTRAAIYWGCDVFAVKDGYNGLVKGDLKQLGWYDVRGFLSIGGTLIGTARNAEFRQRSGRLKAAENLVNAGVDALVVCGGDGSLTGADTFRADWKLLLEELQSSGRIPKNLLTKYPELSVVGLVGSIDNDMSMTDRTIGAFSALERIAEMVDCIDATAELHQRAFVVEVMGRHCGWLALMAGIAGGADYIFIPEQPEKAELWPETLRKVCLRHRQRGNRKTTVIVAEGAIDADLNPITADQVKDVLVGMGLDTRVTKLGHVQRGGSACAYDRMLATLQGVEAVRAVLDKKDEKPPMIGIENGRIVRKPLVDAVAKTRSVAEAIANHDFDRAMSLRDPEFAECRMSFEASTLHDDGLRALPAPLRRRIGVVHVGAPTLALNPVTRALGLYAFLRGHDLYAIENGFSGLIRHGSIRKLHYEDVQGWHNLGGLVIGTNRLLPLQDLGTTAYYLQKHKLDGLVLVGGFEAFKSLKELQEARLQYPVLNIPMVVIPSTVLNNVPGTEYSLGLDTCMNELVRYCDAIKQLALASRRRVFVVDVQGGNLGYVASYTALITGAIACYTPEEKVTLSKIREDIRLLEEVFQGDTGQNRNGKIFVRNEKALDIYTTELLADIIQEQSGGRFGARTLIPGHVQQGNYPSTLDRICAARLGIRTCKFIEEWDAKIRDDRAQYKDNSDPKLRFRYVHGVKHETVTNNQRESACVALIKGSHIGFVPIVDLLESGAVDEEKRRPHEVFWGEFGKVNDMLSGRLYLRKTEEE